MQLQPYSPHILKTVERRFMLILFSPLKAFRPLAFLLTSCIAWKFILNSLHALQNMSEAFILIKFGIEHLKCFIFKLHNNMLLSHRLCSSVDCPGRHMFLHHRGCNLVEEGGCNSKEAVGSNLLKVIKMLSELSCHP